jgi:two-component system sensor histidine kinase BaeS
VTADRFLGPLGARLALAFVAVALSAVGVLAALTLWASRSEVTGLVERRQADASHEITAALGQAYRDAGGWPGADLGLAFALAASARAELVVEGNRGELVASEPASMADFMARMHAGMGTTDGTPLGPSRTVPVTVDGTAVGAARLRFPASGLPAPEREVRDALGRTVLAGAGLAVLLAVAVAVFVSRRVTRPVIVLTGAVRRLEAGDRHARAGPEAGAGPGELGELAVAFDQMADALRRQDELRRNLVADVAHELRTPVTILQASCEEMADGLADPTPERLSSLHEEVLRLGRVVEDLEALNRAEAAGLHLDRRPVDLAFVAAGAVDALRPQFDDAKLHLATDLVPVTIEGDATRLHQVVTNLLTNALKFTPPGGTVTVRVVATGSLACLEVADTGPGIEPAELPHVFERFWRGRAAHGKAGTGIGLAIVAELARAHGGRAEADSHPGAGATFRVLLPQA